MLVCLVRKLFWGGGWYEREKEMSKTWVNVAGTETKRGRGQMDKGAR